MGERDDELELDDESLGYELCQGVDCRFPRVGPFVIDLESRLTLCYTCFADEMLGVSPEEIGLI